MLLEKTYLDLPMTFVETDFNILHIGNSNLKKDQVSFFEGLCALGFNISDRSQGSLEFKTQILTLGCENQRCEVYEYTNFDPKQLAGSNLVLFTGKPKLEILKQCIKKGLVPVMPEKFAPEAFVNFDAQAEKGNCFLYDLNNPWEMVATVVKAHENFKFIYDWGLLVKSLKKVKL